jgi:hypothetical protein
MHVTLGGKRYRLVYTKALPDSVDGDIDPPHKKGKQIRIDKSLVGEDRLEAELHEALHGLLWWADEETVTIGAKELERMLWRIGYRLGE